MITITLPFPDMRLSPNQKNGKHWGATHRLKQSVKAEAWWLAKQTAVTPLKFKRLRVTHDFYPPDKRNRDDDNVIGAFKHARDGVAEALGVDDGKWSSTYNFHAPVKGGKTVLTIEGME